MEHDGSMDMRAACKNPEQGQTCRKCRSFQVDMDVFGPCAPDFYLGAWLSASGRIARHAPELDTSAKLLSPLTRTPCLFHIAQCCGYFGNLSSRLQEKKTHHICADSLSAVPRPVAPLSHQQQRPST